MKLIVDEQEILDLLAGYIKHNGLNLNVDSLSFKVTDSEGLIVSDVSVEVVGAVGKKLSSKKQFLTEEE